MDDAPEIGTVASPTIDWRMSATLENVLRGGEEFPEMTSLEQAAHTWRELDGLRAHARQTMERPISLNGALVAAFTGSAIEPLFRRRPPRLVGDEHGKGGASAPTALEQ